MRPRKQNKAALRRSSSNWGTDPRQERIQAILTEAARRLDRAESITPEALAQQHPELMPELGGQLRVLLNARALASAGSGAAEQADDGPDLELDLLNRELTGYEVLERVRSGGQGAVYRAIQHGTERTVAIKVMLEGALATPRQRARFAREIELVARLHHPNIVAVHECGVLQGRNYYVMDFVEGDPIDVYVALADLTPRSIVELLIKVCSAVHHAHQNGVLHRDLNPGNILVTPEGEPRVYDFGLARDLWTEDVSTTGIGCGTPPYLSPEQAGADGGRMDIRTDVYALGLILYELLADMFPYPVQGDPAAVRREILESEPRPIRRALAEYQPGWAPDRGSVDRDLEMILARALAKDKRDRYQSATDLADDLQRWLDGDAVKARAGHRLYVLRKFLKRHRLTASFAAGLLIALGVGAAGVTRYWLQARIERDTARAATRKALDVFDVALTDLEGELRPLAGGLSARDRLVRQLAAELPALQQLAEADPALEAVAINLLEKRGDVAFQQGDRASAASCYGAFLKRISDPVKTDPTAERVAALLRAHLKVGQTAEAPLPCWDEGIRIGEEWLAQGPPDEAVRFELARLLCASCEHRKNAGHLKSCGPLYERALALCPTVDSNTERRWAMIAATALNGQGYVMLSLGAVADGQAACLKAAQIRAELVARFPADIDCREALLRSYALLGSMYRASKQTDEAISYLLKAADQGDLLATMDPSSTAWARDRYVVQYLLGSLYLDLHDLEHARPACDKAVSLATAWAKVADSVESRLTECTARALQAKLHRKSGDLQQSLASSIEGLKVAEAVLKDNPQNATCKAQVATACDCVAYCYRHMDRFGQAIEYGRRACELGRELVNSHLCTVDYALLYVQAITNLGWSYLDRGSAADLDTATGLFASAEEQLQQLAAADHVSGHMGKYEYLVGELRNAREKLNSLSASLGGAGRQP